MAARPPAHKVRQRNFDRLRQKLWAVPAHLRLKLAQRAGKQPAGRGYRSDLIR